MVPWLLILSSLLYILLLLIIFLPSRVWAPCGNGILSFLFINNFPNLGQCLMDSRYSVMSTIRIKWEIPGRKVIIHFLAQYITLIGQTQLNMAFMEVIKVKWGHNGKTLMNWINVLIRRDTGELALPPVSLCKKTATCKPGKEPSAGPTSVGNLILDFQPPGLGETHVYV